MKQQASLCRIRVPIGFLLAAICALCVAVSMYGDVSQVPRKLVVTNVPSWETSFLATAKSDAMTTETATIADPGSIGAPGYGGVTLTVPPGGADYVRDIGARLSSSEPFYLVDVPVNLDVEALLRFDDGMTRSSFYLPSIGAVTAARSATVGPLIVEDMQQCADLADVNERARCERAVSGGWITVFPTKPGTPVWLIVRDARTGEDLEWETFEASPPVTQYRLQTNGIVFVDVRIGYPWWGCGIGNNCSSYGLLYGFATTGSAAGGNLKPFPFGGE